LLVASEAKPVSFYPFTAAHQVVQPYEEWNLCSSAGETLQLVGEIESVTQGC